MEMDFVKKWERAVLELGVPEVAYDTKSRIIEDCESLYSFGLILNPYRFKSCGKVDNECKLCYALENAEKNESVKICESENYIVIPNISPIIKSASVVIRRGVGDDERKMYRTTDLNGLDREFEEVFGLSRDLGVHLVHNSPGAGASISRHEHWHLVDYEQVYSEIGEYGFDSAEIVDSSVKGVRRMVDFPFAHLVFEEDVDRIINFLKRLHSEIGSEYNGEGVPHGLVKSSRGVLVVPAKRYVEGRGVGGGDMAGHLLCKASDEFEGADYNYCIERLSRTLFRKDEIDLESFL